MMLKSMCWIPVTPGCTGVYQPIPGRTAAEFPRIFFGQITTERFHSDHDEFRPVGGIFCRRLEREAEIQIAAAPMYGDASF
jgi:hypothetical protein